MTDEAIGPAKVDGRALATLAAAVVAGIACSGYGNSVLGGMVVIAVAGLLISLRDIAERVIPARLVYPATAGIVAIAAVASVDDSSWRPLLWALGAGSLVAGLFALIWVVAPSQLGFGDVRLAGLVGSGAGLTMSAGSVGLAVLAAFAGVAMAGVIFRRGSLPFGPFIVAGTLLAQAMHLLVR